jgi:hypothetical protein
MQRTLTEIKKHSLRYWIVEHFNQWDRKRHDLFNIIDLLVLDGGVLGIQVCQGNDYRQHIRKLTEEHRPTPLPGWNSPAPGWRCGHGANSKRNGAARPWFGAVTGQ